MRLRVVTYNVHKCRGMDGRVSTTRIVEVLREVAADVIAVQEVMGEQAEAISAELALPFVIGENRRYQGCAYGNAVLSRFPILGWRNYNLTVDGCEERGCLRADLGIDGASDLLHVFNVHLGTGFGERRHQGRALLRDDVLADAALQHPRVLLGDFNEWTTGLATRLLRAHMKSADIRGRSYPGLLPLLHLDHIYYDEALKLAKFTVHRSRKALVASDHLPLVGDFEVWGVQKENGSK
jgi:endonuclease/exonuclease/phosphatase family metal-dependent hydrolase